MSERFLVVDDDRDCADALARLLGAMGYEAKATYDGASAIELASAYLPDMALIDIGMPHMDGYEAVRRIRERSSFKHVILVALTGWTGAKCRENAYEAGYDLFVNKPLCERSLGELVSLVDPSADHRMTSDQPQPSTLGHPPPY